MTFPVYIPLGPLSLHPHFVFETLAYFLGFRLYVWTRRKERLTWQQSLWIVIGAAGGAAVGSKALYWLEDPALTWRYWNDVAYLLEGKTIVGGLLGGLIGVEWTKRRLGITSSTGDDMVFPLMAALAIGRIGCFLTGLSDHTYGTATSLPWGVDFGDGVARHPTQLYEILFLLVFGMFLWRWRVKRKTNELAKASHMASSRLPDGGLFQLFMAGYLTFRLLVDFIKPTPHPYVGFNNVQLACIAGLIYYISLIMPWWLAKYRGRKETLTDAERR